ncbi:MAG: SDR family NAD(P)-dependent oxidoreductase, partial [Alloalcanivorax venustensis]
RRIQALTPEVHGLINNAGALFNERDLTTEGTERTLAVNLLAPYLLTEKLLPALERARGRVVNVASGGLYLQALHLEDMEFENERFDGAKAYARAKRALVAQTEHWAEQHPGVRFNSMHPGWADTPGVAASLPAFHKRVGPWLRSPRQGADTMVWLASSPAVADISGRFWFDRRPRPTAVLPGTRVTPDQRRQLARWLAARCRPGHGGPL